MIADAYNYSADILRLWSNLRLNPKYDYLQNGTGRDAIMLFLSDNDTRCKNFVSLNIHGDILGFIHYYSDTNVNRASDFTIVSLTEEPSTEFIMDVRECIDDIFVRYNHNSFECLTFVGNPAIRGYNNLIKKCGGYVAGYYHDAVRTVDGKIRDILVYEIMRDSYIKCRWSSLMGKRVK